MRVSPNARLNLLLAACAVLLVGFNGVAFTYQLWGPALTQYASDFWKAHVLQPAVKAGDRTISECLGVSDFYSAHLTTYFLPDSSESAGGATDDMSKYDEYCDRVPGTGKIIFAITLMEKDARSEPVALSFHAYQADGTLKELAALPSKIHGSGMLTLDATVAHKGKYVLKLAFGEAKNKEDTIEMPIAAGQ
ncbi:hypothetical protein [Methylocystis echinoides]|jgi:hypothetical protein|uniref:hypothetical protein n=1 Tax=Methylocystis echinoides TaxID=29468 RepID=UPI003442CFFE